VIDQSTIATSPVSTLDTNSTGRKHSVEALRPTPTARDPQTGRPLDRRAYVADMLARLARESLDAADLPGGVSMQIAVVSPVEAEVIAELLDELAGSYPDEELGQLAGSLAARLWERATR
jgi:hypothetical protein